MEEARRVLERLARIEALRESGDEPNRLLGELRALLVEGEAWLAIERSGPCGDSDAAGMVRPRQALAELGDALDRGCAAPRTVTGSDPEGEGLIPPRLREGVVAETPAV